MTDNVTPPPPARRTPSLFAANTFMLLGIVVLIVASELTEGPVARYLVGIAVEVVLGAIAVAFVLLERLPVRETLRLQWPRWETFGMSVILAVGLWTITLSVNFLTKLLFGYSTPVTPDVFPSDALSALLTVVAATVAAPIFEEIMFRGYVQRAYERKGPWLGIFLTGVLFALYHMRFQGGFALIPIALTLSFLTWRSDSLFPGMLLHAVYNGVVTTLMLATNFLPMEAVAVLAGSFLCLGIIMTPTALGALWGVWRVTDPPALPNVPLARGWRRWAWPVPLLLLLTIFALFSCLELSVGRFPERQVGAGIELEAPEEWERPILWTYAIYTQFDEEVGEATCRLEPQTSVFVLSCNTHYEAFDSEIPFDLSFLDLPVTASGSELTREQQAVWDRATLQLESLKGTWATPTETVTFALEQENGRFHLSTVAGESAPLDATYVATDLLAFNEWPWRLSGLEFRIANGGQLPFLSRGEGGAIEEMSSYVIVRGGEPVWTPAENYVAWYVSLNDEAGPDGFERVAWYTSDPPHTLIRYDDGTVSYLLKSVTVEP